MLKNVPAIPLAILLLLVTVVPVTAKKPSVEDHAYHARVSDAVEEMKRHGRSQDEIDAMLRDDFGWVLVAGGDEEVVLAASENSDVDMRTPYVYYSTQQGRYVAIAWYYWKNCGSQRCWMRDYPFFPPNFGGYDGYGLSIAKLVTRMTQSFSVYTETGYRTTYPNPSDADNSGATFRNQDKVLGPGQQYNWDHGVLTYSFTLRSGCPRGNYQINTKLGHTWASTGVSNITVNTSGISVSFSNTENRWQAVNPVPRNWYPCGS